MKKIRAVHETVVSIFAGMVVGLIIRLSPGHLIREMLVSAGFHRQCGNGYAERSSKIRSRDLRGQEDAGMNFQSQIQLEQQERKGIRNS